MERLSEKPLLLHALPDTLPDQRRLTRHQRGSEVCGVRLLIAGKGERQEGE